MKIKLTKDVIAVGTSYTKGDVLKVSAEQWKHPPASGVLVMGNKGFTILILPGEYEEVEDG